MKAILSNSSIRNTTLRERKDLCPLIKTAIHRYHYDSTEVFREWFEMLSSMQKMKVLTETGVYPYGFEYHKPFSKNRCCCKG